MTPEEKQKLLAERNKALGQRIADVPKTEQELRSNLFGSDEILGGLRSQETAKIQELYEHDKRIADRYANPESEAYLRDPYAREKARATQFQGTVGEIGSIQEQIGKRRDVVGDALDRSMKMLLYGIEASKLERDSLEKEMERETAAAQQKLQNTLSVLGLTGGAIPDEIADVLGISRGTVIPKGGSSAVNTTIVEVGGRKLLIDDRTGNTIKDLGPAETKTSGLSAEEWKMLGKSSAAAPQQTEQQWKVRMWNPDTEEIRGYGSVVDAEYIEDLSKGFQPI